MKGKRRALQLLSEIVEAEQGISPPPPSCPCAIMRALIPDAERLMAHPSGLVDVELLVVSSLRTHLVVDTTTTVFVSGDYAVCSGNATEAAEFEPRPNIVVVEYNETAFLLRLAEREVTQIQGGDDDGRQCSCDSGGE